MFWVVHLVLLFFKSVSLQCMAKGLAPTHQWSELWIYFWFLERTFRVPLPVGGPGCYLHLFSLRNLPSRRACCPAPSPGHPKTRFEGYSLNWGNITRHHHNGNSGVCWSHYPSKLRAQAYQIHSNLSISIWVWLDQDSTWPSSFGQIAFPQYNPIQTL